MSVHSDQERQGITLLPMPFAMQKERNIMAHPRYSKNPLSALSLCGREGLTECREYTDIFLSTDTSLLRLLERQTQTVRKHEGGEREKDGEGEGGEKERERER